MTTKITDIYNNLVTLISTALTAYERLPNPYLSENNNELLKNNGFGIAIGGGIKVDMETCHDTTERSFTIVLTKMMAVLESDSENRGQIDLDMCEDYYTVSNALANDLTLGSEAIRAEITSDSGIIYTDKFISMEINLTVLYQERIT